MTTVSSPPKRKKATKAAKKAPQQGATWRQQSQGAPWKPYVLWLLDKRIWLALLGGLVVAVILYGAWWLMGHLRLEVRQVQFDQVLIYENAESFDAVVNGYKGKDVLRSELLTMKEQIQQLPWIASASVQYQWPGTVHIHVIEERPVASWNDQQLISTTGQLFKPGEAELDLPKLSGPMGQQENVMQRYSDFNTALMNYGQIVKALTVSSGGSWTLTMESGMTIKLGSEDILARFNRALAVLQSHRITDQVSAKMIDARYSNGVAVKMMSIGNGETKQ